MSPHSEFHLVPRTKFIIINIPIALAILLITIIIPVLAIADAPKVQ